MQDEGIIRARAKIEATITNARAFLAMRDAGEDFSAWIWSFVDGKPRMGDGQVVLASTPASLALSKALKAKGSNLSARSPSMPLCRRRVW
jgi:DNA-3-methyladenine glycosylase I